MTELLEVSCTEKSAGDTSVSVICLSANRRDVFHGTM